MIYLDNSATTPVDPRVLKAMLPYFSQNFGNASSLHQAGLDNRVAVDRAQQKIADFLRCDKNEVYFTSGATESDNMAILGVIKAIKHRFGNKKWHIITSKIEHDAILEPCRQLEKEGVEVTYLPVSKQGLVCKSDLAKAIKANTVLVSIMYVNNEVGTIQPIAELGKLISHKNQKRKNKIYFHTDATQAPSYCNCSVDSLRVDMMSLSGHKIYGPKGVGAFYVRKNTLFEPIVYGGHQQQNVRPGTYNVPAIVGLGKAFELLGDKSAIRKENSQLRKWRNELIKEITKKIPDTRVNGDLDSRTSNNVNFIFRGVEGESVLLMLSQSNIATSTGSACSSGSLEPSHVLTAMGISPELAHGSLRITLGRFTKKSDLKSLVTKLPPIIKKLRSISPLG